MCCDVSTREIYLKTTRLKQRWAWILPGNKHSPLFVALLDSPQLGGEWRRAIKIKILHVYQNQTDPRNAWSPLHRRKLIGLVARYTKLHTSIWSILSSVRQLARFVYLYQRTRLLWEIGAYPRFYFAGRHGSSQWKQSNAGIFDGKKKLISPPCCRFHNIFEEVKCGIIEHAYIKKTFIISKYIDVTF
jgi:hypothetical protein